MKCRRVEILVAAVVLFVSTSPVMAALIEFKDGGVHDIDYQIGGEVWVDYESPGMGTTVNMLEGGSITSTLRGWEDSIINMFGGSVFGLDARGNSQVTVSGGGIDRFQAYDGSQVTVSGGGMGSLNAYDSSQFAVSDGSITFYLLARDSSQVAVSGGSMNELGAYGSSQVTVSGGSINWNLYAIGSSQVVVSGGTFGRELAVSDTAVLTIHGWDFAVDGMPVGYTELYSVFGGSDLRKEPHRQLTGTLLSGDPINNGFRIGEFGKLVLVPEPTTILLLGLGAVMARRKR